MAETLQSLQIELARLRRLVGELRNLGHNGFASVLEESLERLVRDIAKLTSAPVPSVTQQQQQVQPDKDDKKRE